MGWIDTESPPASRRAAAANGFPPPFPAIAPGRAALVTLAVSISVLGGCGRTGPPADPGSAAGVEAEASSVSGASGAGQGTVADRYSPAECRRWLAQVLTRYRTGTSYRDRGRVTLELADGADTRSENAPLSVWYDRGVLVVSAYDVRLSSDPRGLWARILDPETDDWDGQVLYRAGGPRGGEEVGRPALRALLSDPVLAGRMSGGLAGPPPQLEWLFADEPMPGLFEPGIRFVDDGFGKLQGRRCRRIRVVAPATGGAAYSQRREPGSAEPGSAEPETGDAEESYRFWIDAERGLIRRVELPDVVLPGSPRVRLTIELEGATFAPPAGPAPKVPMPARPRLVNHFVPLPPPQPPRLLGQRLPRFSIQDLSGKRRLTERGGTRGATLLVAVGDDDASRRTAELIGSWTRRLPKGLADRLTVALLAEPAAIEGLPSASDLAIFRDQGRIAEAAGIPRGGVLLLGSDGTVAWVQPTIAEIELPGLGAVVADVIGDVDVPGRLREQWREGVDAYRESLDDARVRH